jgi:hypothetical protein
MAEWIAAGDHGWQPMRRIRVGARSAGDSPGGPGSYTPLPRQWQHPGAASRATPTCL